MLLTNYSFISADKIIMSGCRVFIGRLSPHARERDVEKFFKGYGRIREINLKNGFGFVVSLSIFFLCKVRVFKVFLLIHNHIFLFLSGI